MKGINKDCNYISSYQQKDMSTKLIVIMEVYKYIKLLSLKFMFQ